MYLFLDTETTGITSEDRIVSICWSLYTDSKKKVSTSHHIILPDGFTIPAGAVAVHGISTAVAKRKGIPLTDALAQLHRDIAAHSPALYVGHNVSFDRPIVLNEYGRVRRTENLSALPTFCTMKSTTNICCIPRWRGGYKWPTLEELHRHLFGKAHASAHDAETDVSACARCFFDLQSRGNAPP